MGAMEHLHLLTSVGLAKQHASQAAQLLPAIMGHLYSAQDPPAACISIVAHLQRSAGTSSPTCGNSYAAATHGFHSVS